MGKKEIIDALNQARADEMMAIVQYMGHHYTASGMESPAVIDLFKKTAIAEMRHADDLAERINYLGGEPTTKPSPVTTGGDLKKMIEDDLAAENRAIASYRRHIKLCADEGDTT